MDEFFNKMVGVLLTILHYHLFKALTVADLLKLIVLFCVLIVAERFLRKHFTMRLLRRTNLEPSSQHTVGRIIGYCFLALGFYTSFRAFFNELNDVLQSILNYYLFKTLTVAELIKLFLLFGAGIVVERFLRRYFTQRLLKRT